MTKTLSSTIYIEFAPSTDVTQVGPPPEGSRSGQWIVPVVLLLIAVVLVGILVFSLVLNDNRRPPTTVEIKFYRGNAFDLVNDFGFTPELADILENASLSIRLTLNKEDFVAINYTVTQRMAEYTTGGWSGGEFKLRNPDIGRHYFLSLELVVTSGNQSLDDADLWGVDNTLNVTFTMTDWYTMELEVEPGYEAFEDHVLLHNREWGTIYFSSPTGSRGLLATIHVSMATE
jgi:hypothetical protein